METRRIIFQMGAVVTAIMLSTEAFASTCADVAYAENQLTNAVISLDIEQAQNDMYRQQVEDEYSACTRHSSPYDDPFYCQMVRHDAISSLDSTLQSFRDAVTYAQNDLAIVRSQLTESC